MTKLNPLLEAMNNIDENIVSDAISATRKRRIRFKPILIAAVVTVLFTATAIPAIANLKAPKQVTINDTAVEPNYKTYTDDTGRTINMYVYDVPDYALGEEQEGGTPVGEIKVVSNPEYPLKWGEWMIIDEAGNKFHTGINNKLVEFEINGSVEKHGFDILNLRDGYEMLEIESEREGDTFKKIDVYFVPFGQGDEILKQRGYNVP